MKPETYFSKLNPRKTLLVCGQELGVSASLFRYWLKNKKMPTRDNMRKLFFWSKGAVEPNDFYPLDDWQRELNETLTTEADES